MSLVFVNLYFYAKKLINKYQRFCKVCFSLMPSIGVPFACTFLYKHAHDLVKDRRTICELEILAMLSMIYL